VITGIFQHSIVSAAHPELSHTEIPKKLGEMWGRLSAEDKAPYIKLAATDKERYDREMLVYNASLKVAEKVGKKRKATLPLKDTPKKKRRTGNGSFPMKLFDILQKEDASIVSWLPSGDAFAVRDNDRFVTDILPQYFRSNKMTSFQRQLLFYGFRRITRRSDSDSGAYRHDCFHRDKPAQCQQMKIKADSRKVNGKRKDAPKKKKRHWLPVEVLGPHTLRRVKLYHNVAAAAGGKVPAVSLTNFLDKGGGYKDGLIYRYLHDYEGIPRKTIVELVASVVNCKRKDANCKRKDAPKKKKRSLPVEVLGPHTLRRVKLYQTVVAAAGSKSAITRLSRFLDKGGGYIDGLIYRYLHDYEGIPRKTVVELVASVVNGKRKDAPKKKKRSLPVEVLGPHTLRRVKLYHNVAAAAGGKVPAVSLTNFLDKGGGYKDGLIYRYLHDYEGIPRKTVVELVASVVATKSDVIRRKKSKVAPKEPRSAYTFFTADKRAEIKEANPKASLGEIGKLLGAAWKALSDGEKAEYIEKSDKDMDRYRNEIKDYTQHQASSRSIPVEVLLPYTLRRVKVYNTSSKSLLQFLDKGGGLYSDGFVYRYLHHYEGIPRKTVVELVASVVAGDISKCSRHGCTSSRHVDCYTYCRTCYIVLEKIATFQNQLGRELESVGFAMFMIAIAINCISFLLFCATPN